MALRSRLTTAQRNATRGPQPDQNRANAIGRYVDELDNYLISGPLPQETLDQLDLARAARDVNERFNRPNDPVAAVLSTKEGRPDVPDSGVAKRFVQPDSGQATNLDRLLAETDLSSQAVPTRQAVRDEFSPTSRSAACSIIPISSRTISGLRSRLRPLSDAPRRTPAPPPVLGAPPREPAGPPTNFGEI